MSKTNMLLAALVIFALYLLFFRRTSGLGLVMQGAGQRNSTMAVGGSTMASIMGQDSGRGLFGADFDTL